MKRVKSNLSKPFDKKAALRLADGGYVGDYSSRPAGGTQHWSGRGGSADGFVPWSPDAYKDEPSLKAAAPAATPRTEAPKPAMPSFGNVSSGHSTTASTPVHIPPANYSAAAKTAPPPSYDASANAVDVPQDFGPAEAPTGVVPGYNAATPWSPADNNVDAMQDFGPAEAPTGTVAPMRTSSPTLSPSLAGSYASLVDKYAPRPAARKPLPMDLEQQMPHGVEERMPPRQTVAPAVRASMPGVTPFVDLTKPLNLSAPAYGTEVPPMPDPPLAPPPPPLARTGRRPRSFLTSESLADVIFGMPPKSNRGYSGSGVRGAEGGAAEDLKEGGRPHPKVKSLAEAMRQGELHYGPGEVEKGPEMPPGEDGTHALLRKREYVISEKMLEEMGGGDRNAAVAALDDLKERATGLRDNPPTMHNGVPGYADGKIPSPILDQFGNPIESPKPAGAGGVPPGGVPPGGVPPQAAPGGGQGRGGFVNVDGKVLQLEPQTPRALPPPADSLRAAPPGFTGPVRPPIDPATMPRPGSERRPFDRAAWAEAQQARTIAADAAKAAGPIPAAPAAPAADLRTGWNKVGYGAGKFASAIPKFVKAPQVTASTAALSAAESRWRDTDEYRGRFGLEPGNMDTPLYEDAAVRGAGVLTDAAAAIGDLGVGAFNFMRPEDKLETFSSMLQKDDLKYNPNKYSRGVVPNPNVTEAARQAARDEAARQAGLAPAGRVGSWREGDEIDRNSVSESMKPTGHGGIYRQDEKGKSPLFTNVPNDTSPANTIGVIPSAGIGAMMGLRNPDEAMSAALAAASARGDHDAVRAHYQKGGGTFRGETAADAAEAELTAELMRTRAGQKKLADYKGLRDQTAATRERTASVAKTASLAAKQEQDNKDREYRLDVQTKGVDMAEKLRAGREASDKALTTKVASILPQVKDDKGNMVPDTANAANMMGTINAEHAKRLDYLRSKAPTDPKAAAVLAQYEQFGSDVFDPSELQNIIASTYAKGVMQRDAGGLRGGKAIITPEPIKPNSLRLEKNWIMPNMLHDDKTGASIRESELLYPGNTFGFGGTYNSTAERLIKKDAKKEERK